MCSRRTGMMESTRTTPGPGQRETDQSSRPSQNSSNVPNRRPGGSAPQGKPPDRRGFWMHWHIIFIVVNLNVYAPLTLSSLSSQQSSINLSYTSLLQQVQKGNEMDVTLTAAAI